MGELDAQQVIGVWERGRHASAQERALLLAELAGVDASQAERLALGARDAVLVERRIALYGAEARAAVSCPACREGLEFRVDFQALCALGNPDPGGGPWTVECDAFRVRFRLPTGADLLAVAERERAGEAARAALIERIVLAAERHGDPVSSALLPAEVVSALEAEIERLDPISDIRFAQTCPACQARFVAPFDVARFFWRELDVDARRLLQEVDLLARSYGWSEREILAMSRARRMTYLELCGLS